MTSPRPLPRGLAYASLGLALWFLVSWPVGLLLDPERLTRPGELEYLLGDLLVLLPLSLATGVGLLRGQVWAAPLFLVTAGGLAYDALHFGVHQMRAQSSALGRLGVGLGLVLLLGAVAFAVRLVLRALKAAPPNP